jgi:hypothetical protein
LKEKAERAYRDYNASFVRDVSPTRQQALREEAARLRQEYEKALKAIKNARAAVGLNLARHWVDILKAATGGVQPQIAALRIGSRAYAHYDPQTRIIGLSEDALARLRAIRKDPSLLFKPDEEIQRLERRLKELKAEGRDKGNDPEYYKVLFTLTELRKDPMRGHRAVYAFSAVVHEFLHSINPAGGAYEEGPQKWVEEGLTEAITGRMVQRPDIVSLLLGKKVDQSIEPQPATKYVPYITLVEYLAERAALRHKTTPEWFLGKWKLHTPPRERLQIMREDAGLDSLNIGWNAIFNEAQHTLERVREQRLKQQRGDFKKAIFNAWLASKPGFLVRQASYIPFSDSIETHSGGGQGGLGPAMIGGQGGAGMIDIGRHTSSPDGSPPKGEGFQKFPRGTMKCRGCMAEYNSAKYN